jgi:ferredoxin-NADP reductase
MTAAKDRGRAASASTVPGNAVTRMAVPNLPDPKPPRRIVGPSVVALEPGPHILGPGFDPPWARGKAAPAEARREGAAAVPFDRAAAVADVPPRFDAEVDEVLVCRQVRIETHDVKTFVFSPASPRLFRHKPGQFLTFEFPVGPEPVQRCYTIASSPTRPDTVSITVKRVPGGPVSNWLHDTMAPGMTVRALGPMGEFTCLDHPAEKYLFLSGGSGVTPLMSMSRAFHDLGEDRDIAFVHAARTPADIIFRAELALMARANPCFKVAHVVESDAGGPGWAGFRGRLSLPMLGVIAPDFRERTVFTCGPAPFMAAVRAILAEAGFDMARYYEESFNFDELADQEKAEAEAADAALSGVERPAGETFRVEFVRSGRVIEVPADRSVLTAARQAGMRLPSSCTKGLCGTCKSKIVSGKVEMSHAGGIRQREIDEGFALLCCAKPLSDLVIER